jgi:DNA (cytosine-5)-methyltransferase 1
MDINICAGAGGLAIGLQMAGFGPLELLEKDQRACDTLQTNIESPTPTLCGTVWHEDVTTFDWSRLNGEARLLAGAVPCQPFSLGGRHRADEDDRNLFPAMLRAIRELRPSAVLIENVRGLLRTDFQPYFEYVLRQLECPSVGPTKKEDWRHHAARIRKHQCTLGYQPEYRVSWRLLDAADYGVPQNRTRVFVVCTRVDLPQYDFPVPTHSKQALIQRMARRSNGTRPTDGLLPWATVREAIAGLPKPSKGPEGARMNHWMIPGARSYAGHVGSRLDWPSKGIKAGVHGVPGGENTVLDAPGSIRYYTLRETARVQTFPDEHVFLGARLHVTRQLGNAVPCKLAAAVSKPLFQLLATRS